MQHKHDSNHALEYFKFFGVLSFVTAVAAIHADWQGFGLMQFLESFMGVFFIVFAAFKLVNLKVFAESFKTYEKMKDQSIVWGYIYPFVQLTFGIWYLLGGVIWLDIAVLLWSGYGSYIVWLTLRAKGDKIGFFGTSRRSDSSRGNDQALFSGGSVLEDTVTTEKEFGRSSDGSEGARISKEPITYCACLGNVIKLPLSTISFVEDFAMTIMAGVMIFLR